jgi:16S rRNA (guanine527-N7)-methyltransferase
MTHQKIFTPDEWCPLIDRVLAHFFSAGGIEGGAVTQLITYLSLANQWNQKLNLTGARSADEFVDLFVSDGAVLARAVGAASGERWVDVGSGAGAPAIALALLAPEIQMTLIEPRTKRAAFLRSVIGTLGRGDIRVERRRSQELPEARWHVAMSRAALPPDQWLKQGSRLASSVWVLLGRGDWPTLKNWRREQELVYRWPLTGAERRAARFVRVLGA